MSKSKLHLTEDIYTLIPSATQFHGHLGPYLILGLKAGIAAIEALGRYPFKMKAIVTTKGEPPSSCFIDGVQLATGCTMGKLNIEARKGDKLSALFILGGETLEIKIREKILEEMPQNPSRETVESLALYIAEKKIDELFYVEKRKKGESELGRHTNPSLLG